MSDYEHGELYVYDAETQTFNLAAQQSVLQPWVMQLPRREQGVLLTATRSCDTSEKPFEGTTNVRKLITFLRYTFMVPADKREVGITGAFMSSQPPLQWKASEFGHYAVHWYGHFMHAYQVVAYRHPDHVIAHQARHIYLWMVESLHLHPEPKEEMITRLSEDRIKSGKVVS